MNVQRFAKQKCRKDAGCGRVTADAENLGDAELPEDSLETDAQGKQLKKLTDASKISFIDNAGRIEKKRCTKSFVPLKPCPVLPLGRADKERTNPLRIEFFFDKLGNLKVSAGASARNRDQSLAFLLTIKTIPMAMVSASMELPP
jgi:hypothetical protein